MSTVNWIEGGPAALVRPGPGDGEQAPAQPHGIRPCRSLRAWLAASPAPARQRGRDMARRATGQIIERKRTGKDGPVRVYAIRFRTPTHGRVYTTLGSSADGWTRSRAEEALADTLSDVRRGLWRPAEPE